ncbi:MAG: hypothetical protein SFX73_27945 [Kofleriaceae bacterium]|nr:hypothetical protein [Kofleriaceae bacterium]
MRYALLAVAPALACTKPASAEARLADDNAPVGENPRAALNFARDYALRPQLQVDGGLSIIGIGYEHPIGHRLALQVEAGTFGTYFLPWFDLGDRVIGAIGGIRLTWFARPNGYGPYVTPYVRSGYAWGEHAGQDSAGVVITAGAFVGWAFRLAHRLDLRLGVGGQYIYINGDNGLSASTPFVALDATIGYRF